MTHTTDIEILLGSLTLDEKISLLSGQSLFETRSIPGKVPCVKLSDGPNGARGASFVGTVASACFPAASCLAATFDTGLVRRVGEALGEEAQSKGARCLLAPTVCIHRHPLGGRNFETFSEDPLLTGKLASQIVQGLQCKGISGTVKHFVANEQETERMRVNTLISERALREIYLRPFEIVIKEAEPWAVMTAYNMVNNEHCDSSRFLLKQVLRGEWGWEGLVLSDWGGTNSSAGSVNAGLDLEMPGPPRQRTIPAILQDISEGSITKETIDDRSRAVLKFLQRVGAFKDPTIPSEQAMNTEEHRNLIRDAGARGCVLLKNTDDTLPISRDRLSGKRVALLGFAKTTLAHGGGSAAVRAHYKISPFNALQEAVGDIAQLTYAKGAHTERFLRSVASDTDIGDVVDLAGEAGWTQLAYEPATQKLVSTTHGLAISNLSPFNHGTQDRIIDFICYLTPRQSGPHYFGISGVGPTQVFVDEKLVCEQKDHTLDALGFIFGLQAENLASHSLMAGTAYRLQIRTLPCAAGVPASKILTGRPAFRFGMAVAAEHDADLLSEAVDLAKAADYAVVFTGHTEQWETEGQDQVSFHLPKDGSQDALVTAVAEVNPQTIVVNSTGVPVAMPWLDKVPAVVQTWFGGQEAGNSIADILIGVINPEGNLPVTFPKAIKDAPAHDNFPGTYVNQVPTVEYKEGVFVGYRHFDRIPRDKVNFAFGHGLSYSTFEYGELQVNREQGDHFLVSVSVTNAGRLAGGTLVQLYAGLSETNPSHPVKSLVGFCKVRLEPGQSRVVTLTVPSRELAYFDEQACKWVVTAGAYLFTLGLSAADPVKTAVVLIENAREYDL